MLNLKLIANTTLKVGGMTINLDGEAPLAGYVVARYPELEAIVCSVDLEESLVEFCTINQDELLEEGNFLGTWFHEDCVHLDIVSVFEDLECAILSGILNQQIAIFDLNKNEEIEIDSADS